MSNITKIVFKDQTRIEGKPLYQYDHGQKLKFIDLNLPYSYEVHFSNYERGTSLTQIGNSEGVLIPDSLLQTGLDIYVWIYLHTGLDDGETEYMLTIPVYERAKITNEQPTIIEQTTISQIISELNTAESAISSQMNNAAQSAADAREANNQAQACRSLVEGYRDQIENSVGNGYITIGHTRLTESELQQLLALISE